MRSTPLFRRAPVAVFHEDPALFIEVPMTQQLLRLNETGWRIWEHLEYPIAPTHLCRRLSAEFAGDQEEITAQVHYFLEALQACGLVETRSCAPTPAEVERQRYLWLLKRALVNLIYPEHELRIESLETAPATRAGLDQQRFLRDIRYQQSSRFTALCVAKRVGDVWQRQPPRFSHTRVGLSGLDNLERCAEQIFAEGTPGDFLEAGVWVGGAAIFLRALQVAFGQSHRRLWAADSFQGLPSPQSAPDLEHNMMVTEERYPWMCLSLEGVQDNFVRYDLLDDRVCFLAGWYSDTLSAAPVGQLALLHIDAALYQSTREVLDTLYDKVSPGGFIVVDDYGASPPCRLAVDEFRAQRAIAEPLRRVDKYRVFWRKAA